MLKRMTRLRSTATAKNCAPSYSTQLAAHPVPYFHPLVDSLSSFRSLIPNAFRTRPPPQWKWPSSPPLVLSTRRETRQSRRRTWLACLLQILLLWLLVQRPSYTHSSRCRRTCPRLGCCSPLQLQLSRYHAPRKSMYPFWPARGRNNDTSRSGHP